MIIDTVKNRNGIWVSMACLDYKEAMVLQKLLPKEIKKSKKRVEHYRDIQDGGDATERQQTLLVDAEEYDEMLDSLDRYLNIYIKNCKRGREEINEEIKNNKDR